MTYGPSCLVVCSSYRAEPRTRGCSGIHCLLTPTAVLQHQDMCVCSPCWWCVLCSLCSDLTHIQLHSPSYTTLQLGQAGFPPSCAACLQMSESLNHADAVNRQAARQQQLGRTARSLWLLWHTLSMPLASARRWPPCQRLCPRSSPMCSSPSVTVRPVSAVYGVQSTMLLVGQAIEQQLAVQLCTFLDMTSWLLAQRGCPAHASFCTAARPVSLLEAELSLLARLQHGKHAALLCRTHSP